MTVTITVPAVPTGHKPAACWRRALADVHPGAPGGYATRGEWLYASDVVTVPDGTLVLSVDRKVTGEAIHYRTHRTYTTESATVTVLLAADGKLTQLWTRAFKHAKSAFGAQSLKKMAGLLEKYPAPSGEITVVEAARRLNDESGYCRWCGGYVSKLAGQQVGGGDDAQVECWKNCLPQKAATSGTPCTQCGVTVHAADAELVMIREGEGRWETRHRPLLECTRYPVPSYEEMQQEKQDRKRAEQEAEQRRARDRARREEKKQQKQAAQPAAHEAEQQRIASLATVSSTSRVLYSKRLGELLEHTDVLEDGTTTLRWTVETGGGDPGWTGEDYDPEPRESAQYTRLADARSAYQALKPPPRPAWSPVRGRTCDNCGNGGAVHHRRDSSGIAGIVCDSCAQCDEVELSFA